MAKARLYATALGKYEVQLNGAPVSDTYFAPGWTNYRKRLQYQTYSPDAKPLFEMIVAAMNAAEEENV